MNPYKTYKKVLSIAGSDTCGGAGIQADLKTFSATGSYGMTVITALTAQNTTGVSAIFEVPADFVAKQMDAVFSDVGADAVKIGMLFSKEIVSAVADKLVEYRIKKIVLDPVMVAQSSDRLLLDDAIGAIKELLIPISTVVTPNLPEAEILSGIIIRDERDMESAARKIADHGCGAVLVKGGHGNSDKIIDLLYLKEHEKTYRFEGDRIMTNNNHGTGCTLSSAIASFLATGCDLQTACAKARSYLKGAIAAGAGYSLGRGHGPVHHLYGFWN